MDRFSDVFMGCDHHRTWWNEEFCWSNSRQIFAWSFRSRCVWLVSLSCKLTKVSRSFSWSCLLSNLLVSNWEIWESSLSREASFLLHSGISPTCLTMLYHFWSRLRISLENNLTEIDLGTRQMNEASVSLLSSPQQLLQVHSAVQLHLESVTWTACMDFLVGDGYWFSRAFRLVYLPLLSTFFSQITQKLPHGLVLKRRNLPQPDLLSKVRTVTARIWLGHKQKRL